MDHRKRILESLKKAGDRNFANDYIGDHLLYGDLELIEGDVANALEGVLDALLIDIENDHNTQETARRVAKMFVHETFAGRFYQRPKTTSFPNTTNYNGLYVTGPITIRSTCAHHFMPIRGEAFVGIFPGEDVIGLSKFNRLVDWIASRPQIQEEMTSQIADELESATKARGVAVLVKAEHFCVTHRGVKEHESGMVTSVMRGAFRDDPALKAEFLSIVGK